MTNASVTLQETGIEAAITRGNPRGSSRDRVDAARERIFEHSLKLEDARAYAAYGQNSSVGKILGIHQELPGRIHVVLIRQSVGF
jgi:hypothetical protein